MKNKLLMTLTLAGLLLLSVQTFAQAPPLGTAADFVLFTTVGAVGNTGISHVTGNVGTNSGAITGFGNVNGVMHTSNGATAQCAADLLIAYNHLNSAIPNYFPAPLLGNGQILEEGVYAIAGPATLNNELTLDAQNNPDAVFIFQINGAFSTAALSSVTLINGAQACNVFWKIEGLVDMATGTAMRGTVIANNGAIDINADGVLEGRALSTSGAVNVTGVLVYTPIGCGSPVLMGPAAPDLSSAACYAIFSGNGPVSNAGITHVVGDVGTNVGLTTGFDPLLVTGMIHPIPDGSTAAAAADLLNAYNYLNTLPFDIELLFPAQFGNDLVLTPHTYLLNAATTFTGDLYLDAGGQADAVFVIQINGALTTSTYANVILVDGTKPENVFWKVDGAVAINDYSNFVGTIVANNGAVDLTTGANLEGRAFTTTGALSTASVTVTMPPGCGDFTAPEIVTQPENQTVCIGEPASFMVVAEGLNLTYQWRKGIEELTDGGNLTGTTSNELTIDPAGIDDAASDYNVVVSGTYSPDAISEDVSLTVQLLPGNVNAGDDATTCANCPYTFSGVTAENYSSLLWTTTGDGTFDDATSLNPVYTPGLTDPGTTVVLCLSVNPIAPCEGLPVEDCMELEVLAVLLPTANAGVNQEICEDQVAQLVGEAENYSTVLWSTDGDGQFSAPNSLITNYTPGAGDLMSGTVELCLTAQPDLPGADPAIDCMILSISGLPAVDAGNDATTCANCPYTFSGVTAENYSSLLWTTTGDGTFDDATSLNPVYTPGLTDPGTTVVLCLSVNPIAPCEGLPVEDCMELEVLAVLLPTANAGVNQEICEDQVAQLVGEAENYSTVLWSTDGDGQFSALNSLITNYTPGAGDLMSGTVELCLTAQPDLPGADPAIDCMILSISGLPAVDAGNDATTCANCPYTFSGVTAENYSSLLWTTTGDGTFDDATSLNPVYTPGLTDPGTTVVLCLSANPIAPCEGLPVGDCMELEVLTVLLPVANVGGDQEICEDQVAELFGEAENYSTVLWSTDGDGVFTSPNALITDYTPGTNDITSGTAELCLTAALDGTVPVSDVDCMTLTIYSLPIVNAGSDATVCEGELFQLGDAFVENTTDFVWSTDGNGSFDDPLAQNPTYDPTNDVAGEKVTLCLAAQPIAPCVGEIVSCVELYIQPNPMAFAGNDATILMNENYFLFEAMADNFAGLLWETSGDGGFDPSDDILQPTYIPGAQDISDGEVLLTLTAFGFNNCNPMTHGFYLTVFSIPPTVEIQSPVDGAYIDFSPLLVEGIADDEDGTIAFVEVRINGGVWQLASGAEIWSIEVQPEPCFNTIEARATDSQGLQSEIDMVTNIEFNGQLLELNEGWSYISSYIETPDPNFFTLEEYITPANSLVIMLNDNGQIFWPSQNINNLVSWDTHRGYKAKSTADATWLLAGDNTADQTITLHSSYNIFPVLSNVPYELPGDFKDDDILIIFELQTQKIYWPDGGLYSLSELKPGFGYLGSFYNSFDITFDPYVECDVKLQSVEVEFAINNSPWQFERTANVHLISVTADAVAEIDNPTFIGAFDANGMCIGYADVREKADNYLMVVFGDEESTTVKDGALSGEPINLIAYNGIEKPVVATYDLSLPEFDGNYTLFGLSKITSLKESSTGIENTADADKRIEIFPNPASELVTITSNVDIRQISMINLTGQTILDYPVIGTNVQVNISGFISGLYFIKVETIDNYIVTKRLSIK